MKKILVIFGFLAMATLSQGQAYCQLTQTDTGTINDLIGKEDSLCTNGLKVMTIQQFFAFYLGKYGLGGIARLQDTLSKIASKYSLKGYIPFSDTINGGFTGSTTKIPTAYSLNGLYSSTGLLARRPGGLIVDSNIGPLPPSADTAWYTEGNTNTKPNYNFLGTTSASNEGLMIKTHGVQRARWDTLGFYYGQNIGFTGLIEPYYSSAYQHGTSGQVLTSEGSSTPQWTNISAWELTGNAGTVFGTNFVGTTDSVVFQIRANNKQVAYYGFFNTFLGEYAGSKRTTGINNEAFGNSALYTNTTASGCVAVGWWALYNGIATGSIAVGDSAGYGWTTTTGNTAIGWHSLVPANNGNCTALGYSAGIKTTGNNNTFIGTNSGANNTSGIDNTGIGDAALFNNTGSNNTGISMNGGYGNTTGKDNVFIGTNSGLSNANASSVTFIGFNSGYNSTAAGNTFVGDSSGVNVVTGKNNTFIGNNTLAGTASQNNGSAIGYGAVSASSVCAIGGTTKLGTAEVVTSDTMYNCNASGSKVAGSSSGYCIFIETWGGTNSIVKIDCILVALNGTAAYTFPSPASLEMDYTIGTKAGASGVTVSALSNTAVTISALSSTTGSITLFGK